MVTRETSYIGQLYFGLSTDDPTAIEWHNGDRILLMDEDKMFIYDEAAVTFHEIPMGGGGGGGSGDIPLQLLYSGDYTLAAAASGINIPVPENDLDSTRFRAFFVVRDAFFSGTAIQSSACIYLYYPEDMVTLTNARKWVRTQTRSSDGTTHYYYGDVNGAENTWFNYSPELQIHVGQYSNNYNLRAGLYHWYVWGYPAP